MAWTAPKTWTPGETVDAAGMNLHARDNLNHLNGLAAGGFTALDRCSVYRTANWTVPTASWSYVSWDAEFLDSNTMHDNATNPDRITIQTTGTYIAGMAIYHTTHASCNDHYYILPSAADGTLQGSIDRISTAYDTYGRKCTTLGPMDLTAGAYYRFGIYQSSGGTRTYYASNSYAWVIQVA